MIKLGRDLALKKFTNSKHLPPKTFDEETELKSLKKNKHRMSANILHWNKADGINANKNKATKEISNAVIKATPQSRFSFMYNRNAYDYGDKEMTIIKKVPLKNLFVCDKEDLLKNPNEDIELIKSAFKKHTKALI